MNTKYIYLIIILLSLQPLIFLPNSTHLAEAKMKDATHQSKEISTANNMCAREFLVESEFEKPKRDPIDLVIVQDASGSFENTINDIKSFLIDTANILEADDRVQITTYRGTSLIRTIDADWHAKGYYSNWNTWSSGRHPVTVETKPLTAKKEVFNDYVRNFKIGGGTPTPKGLKDALVSYEANKGDISDRKTLFLHITDGVANTNLSGHIVQRSHYYHYNYHYKENDWDIQYKTPSGVRSPEYNHYFQPVLREVEQEAKKIHEKGYKVMVGFWEDFSILESSGQYEDRYRGPLKYSGDRNLGYPVRPRALETLNKTATSEDLVVHGTTEDGKGDIHNFIRQMKGKINEELKQPNTRMEYDIHEGYTVDLKSVKINGKHESKLVKLEGNKLKVDLSSKPSGRYKVTYEIKEKEPLLEEHIASTGLAVVDDASYSLPDVIHGKNTQCEIKPEVTKQIYPMGEWGAAGPRSGKIREEIHLNDYNEEFVFVSDYKFNYITKDINSIVLKDELEPVFEVLEAKVVDSSGREVMKARVDGKNVTAELPQKDKNFNYLNHQKYRLIIKAKLKAGLTSKDLAKYPDGVPNTSEIIYNNQPTESNTVHVFPPTNQPTVAKTVNKREINNLDEVFTWRIDYSFGDDLSGLDEILLIDEVDEILEVLDVRLELDGKDALSLGSLSTRYNIVNFSFKKQRRSFRFLEGKEATMYIDTRIREGVNLVDLEPYLKDGIINDAELVLSNKKEKIVINTEHPTQLVIPKLGQITILKIDAETRKPLSNAEFKLVDRYGTEYERLVTGKDGKAESDLLPLGTYFIEEIKAPAGYQILTKEQRVKLDQAHQIVELEVENKKNAWVLPDTGGIGPILYGLSGLAVMLVAALIYLRRKYV